MDDPTVAFQTLGISLVLGLLVGLQRERTRPGLAGLRTFPMITVLGTLAGYLAQQLPQGGWIVAAGVLAVVAIIAIEHFRHTGRSTLDEIGTTTEVAILLMFLVGAYLAVGSLAVGVAIGGGVAVLLQFKPELHGLVEKLGDDDVRAIMQFVLITCVILPVVPNQRFGPTEELRVLNPREIWLMVVLIVGISLGGYIAYKFLGQRAGIVLGGILGGAISSTATTVSFARRATKQADAAMMAALVIVIAACVVYGRVFIEISAVGPSLLPYAIGPIAIMLLLTVAPAVFLWLRVGREKSVLPEQENPTELRSAFFFATMFAVVLLALATAKQYLGGQGLYVVAAMSGLTDMDAITLSTSRLVETERVAPRQGWQLIVIAAMSNMFFKTGIVAAISHGRVLRIVAAAFAVPVLGGMALLAFWPWPLG